MKFKLRVFAAALALPLALSGCTTLGLHGVQDYTLPGGANVGSHPYTVTVDFPDVLNLVPQAAVQVNNVAVGRVTKITLPRNGWNAQVKLLVNGDVHLPANAYAEVEQSSLLGEKYIQLEAPPPGTATGTLANGATIPASRTNRNAEVEEVFGALSLLLNGGGIAQIHTISTELDKTLTGNEPQIRSLLTQVTTLLSNLNANRKSITDALDGMNRLATTLNTRRGQISQALDQLTPGLRVLDQQKGAMVGMLQAMDKLSLVAVKTINDSQADFVADLKALAPTLKELADSGKDLPQSLQVLITYPFTDAVLPAIKGDYMNVYLSVTGQGNPQIIPSLPLPSVGGH